MVLRAFRHWPIRRKMSAIIVLSVWLGGAITSILLIAYDQKVERENLITELETLLDIVSQSASAALAFEDKQAAEKNLSYLKQSPDVVLACLYDTNLLLFADFHSDGGLRCSTASTSTYLPAFTDAYISASRAVYMRNTQVGYLELRLSLEKLQSRIRKFSLVAIFIQMLACILAYLITVKLQKSITQPIVKLAAAAHHVSDSKDFSVRVERLNEDELGQLVNAFNSMLHKIQQTNLALTETMQELRIEKLKSDEDALSANSRAKAIREFFAGASHDLRQPLHAMSLFLDAIKSGQRNDKELLSKLEKSVFNLAQLFNDLLDLSKLEAKLAKPQLQPVKLSAIFERILTDFEILARDKDLRFSVFCSDMTVLSDEGVLERIVRNLVSNAIRYTDSGGVILAARRQADKVAVEVWDSGRGMTAEQQKIVFDEYVQLEAGDRDKDGFGLGLSIVYRLVSLLSHELVLKSQAGRGTVFKVLIKNAATKNAEPDHIAALMPADINVPLNPLQGKKVLAIDDDVEILQALAENLVTWGMEVYKTNDPVHAQEIVVTRGFLPDVIVSDFCLGHDEKGTTLIANIRKVSACKVPAIIITGESSVKSLQIIEKSGIPFLSKPVKAAKFRSLLAYVLREVV